MSRVLLVGGPVDGYEVELKAVRLEQVIVVRPMMHVCEDGAYVIPHSLWTYPTIEDACRSLPKGAVAYERCSDGAYRTSRLKYVLGL